MLITNLAVKYFIEISLFTKIQIHKICVYLRPNSGFRIWGLGFCKQQKTLCLRGLRVRKMVVWDGV